MNRKRYFKKRYIIPAAIVGAPVALALFVVLGGGVVMLLWNWLLPSLFGLPAITIWQGFGLLVLCRILFGGFGGGGRSHSHRTRDFPPEDRERFRQRMRERFGCVPGEPDAPAPVDIPARPSQAE